MEKSLAGWKKLYLSKGGRQIVIQCTLSSSPTYILLLFTIPSHIANRLEKFCSVIFVKRMYEEFKLHLVDWNLVCSTL